MRKFIFEQPDEYTFVEKKDEFIAGDICKCNKCGLQEHPIKRTCFVKLQYIAPSKEWRVTILHSIDVLMGPRCFTEDRYLAKLTSEELLEI